MISLKKTKELICKKFELEAIKGILTKVGNKLPVLDNIIWNSYGITIGDCHITGLGLYNANLNEIPEEISQLKKLKKLNLNNNEIRSIPDFITSLIKLEEIFLSGNTEKVSNLPKDISKLINLRLLILNRNNLSLFPSDFAKLDNLQILRLDDNLFDHLGDDIFSLKSLEYLYLKRNKISTIDSIQNPEVSKLKVLFLDDNKLTSVPNNISRLENLEILSLTNNNLSSLPKSLNNLKKLKILKIDSNKDLENKKEVNLIIKKLERKGCRIN